MRMLKGDSNMLNFDQLMAQATQVAKQQDASLMERARQKRREEDERRRKEEAARREREETQAQLNRKRELQDKKQKSLFDQKKQQRELDRKRPQSDKLPVKSRTNTTAKSSSSKKATSISNLFPEKKKPVHMSFDDLMKKAKEQSLNKPETKAPMPPKKYASHDSLNNNNNTPTLYHRLKRPELSKTSTSNQESMSARERARQLIAEPPKKLNVQKRDRRTIADVQREIRHKKGIHSDEEDDTRLIARNRNRPTQGRIQRSLPQVDKRKQQASPPIPRAGAKRLPHHPPPPSIDRRAPPPQMRRMPFSGKPLDPVARKAVPKRRYREEEEMDDELASFIVDDEDDDDRRYSRGPRRNSYSDEISKIFKYDRSRYANDPVYSDDDMEANASDVLREEKRSERLARREDLIEEQKELERLKRRKKSSM